MPMVVDVVHLRGSHIIRILEPRSDLGAPHFANISGSKRK
jgi:hypothetical protein